jgi:hypothetical protein
LSQCRAHRRKMTKCSCRRGRMPFWKEAQRSNKWLQLWKCSNSRRKCNPQYQRKSNCLILGDFVIVDHLRHMWRMVRARVSIAETKGEANSNVGRAIVWHLHFLRETFD